MRCHAAPHPRRNGKIRTTSRLLRPDPASTPDRPTARQYPAAANAIGTSIAICGLYASNPISTPPSTGRLSASRTPATNSAAVKNSVCPDAMQLVLTGATTTPTTVIAKREHVATTAQTKSASVPSVQTRYAELYGSHANGRNSRIATGGYGNGFCAPARIPSPACNASNAPAV